MREEVAREERNYLKGRQKNIYIKSKKIMYILETYAAVTTVEWIHLNIVTILFIVTV